MTAARYTIDTLTDSESEHALDRAINGLRDDDPLRSAAIPVMGWQKVFLSVLLIGVIALAIWRPNETAVGLIGVCTFGYVCTMADRVLIFRRGLAARPITVTDAEARAIPDDELPMYTILVPAYNEPEVVDDLIGALAGLEYPADKLQVLLLLEADDDVTIEAAKRCKESDAINILLVPPAEPRTKPKACNYGLHFAAGDIVTIYDAEDIPERSGQAGLPQRPAESADRMVHRRVRPVVRLPTPGNDAYRDADSVGRYVESSSAGGAR
jgi:glycosyltransferase XagB